MSSTETEEGLAVTFFPPLHHRRRMWILDVLRQEHVRSLLDVGCGEGELLSTLCNPAPWLPPPDTDKVILLHDHHTNVASTPDVTAAAFTNTANEIKNLHLARLEGLDISTLDLELAIDATAPAPASASDTTHAGTSVEQEDDELAGPWSVHHKPPPRWDELEVQIWRGGLEVPNSHFVGIECIVATEVIEHLRPAALAAFAPVLLGLYSPRLFLVTTPSYTFNARFHAPGAPRPGGFADPTGRTERIFRHHDHQFEWTPAEFGAWCHTAADLWGYELAHFGGVGTPREADPYGRDDELGCATQVALFRRREGDAAAASRYAEYDRWLHAQQLLQQQQTDASAALRSTTAAHELLATHRYESHPLSQAPLAVAEIGKLVEEKMCRFHAPEIAIHDLWNTSPVSSACGGWLELLIAGVNEREGLQLHPTEGRPRSEWLVTCAHATPPPPIDQDDAESTIRSSGIEIDSEDEYEIEYRKEGENDAVALNSWERYALPSDLQDSNGGWGVETGSNGWGAEAQGRGWGSSDYDVAGSWNWSTLQEKQHPTTQ